MCPITEVCFEIRKYLHFDLELSLEICKCCIYCKSYKYIEFTGKYEVSYSQMACIGLHNTWISVCPYISIILKLVWNISSQISY